MRKVEYVLHDFAELSEAAKKVAIDEVRDSIGEIRSESDSCDYRETLQKIERAFDIEVYDWEVSGYRPSHYRFKYLGDLDDETPKMLPRYFERIWRDVFKGKYIGWRESKGKPYYSKVLFNEESFSLVGMWTDDAVVKTMAERYEFVRQGCTISDFIDTMLCRFFEQWREDMEYAYSDESIEIELSEGSYEYEFLENGKLWESM